MNVDKTTETDSAGTPRAESEASFRLLVESARDYAIFMIDPQGRITTWNSGAEHILGYAEAEIIGQPVDVLFTPEDRDQGAPEWERRTAATEGRAEDKRWHVRKDGSRLWANGVLHPLYGNDSTLRGFGKVLRDETGRRRAEQDLTARVEREQLINQIGQAIRVSLDSDVVQARAMTVLGKGLNADRCYFSLFDAEHDTIQVGRDWHRADLPSLTGTHHPSDLGLDLEEMYPAGQILVLEDVRSSPWPALDRFDLRALISVPFYDKGRLVAAVTVGTAGTARAWTPDEVALVETTAAQIRAAVEAARILERERNVVLSLQESLLPPIPRTAPGLTLANFYKAALAESNIGGDFADVFALADNCTALVVGDLSGKGLAAAAQVATVRNMLRCLLYLEETLADAVTKLNTVLSGQGLLTGFVTLFVGSYDADAHTLSFVSCGHEPGLLRRADGGGIEVLPTSGPILGAIPDVRYQEHVISLQSQDALVLYTDGLTEAGPSPSQFLELSGLMDLIRVGEAGTPQALVAQIIGGVQAHAQGALRDDVCLLVAAVR